MITFIIPSLNRPTLVKTIDSLLNQTNPNWNAIIVYDGVDGNDFEDKRISTFKIIKSGSFSPHHGMSGLVRDYGIEKCNTEWIGFLDDDDTIDSNYVETLQKKYSKYDFVVWRMKEYYGRVIPGFDNNNLVFGDAGISFCYKKNIFKELYFSQNRDGEDFDFLMELKKKSNNFIITPEVMYNIKH